MNHTEINALLDRLGSTLRAAELHGLLCGLLGCLPSARAKTRWYSELVASTAINQADLARHASDLKALEAVFDTTTTAYNSADLSLQVLLPDDQEPVAVRAEGLAMWCTGFCFGIGLGTGWGPEPVPSNEVTAGGARHSGRTLPADTLELLTDFTAISRADTYDDETDEAALFELQEYVRMGALLIGDELMPSVSTVAGLAPDNPILH